ncbi:hypothetical protein [uncultured Methylibium sp.]|uniref:hypothetical protein n=1 Tax=uncultured Methylibium sp. TaxID=381093 RepID=UPI0025F91217|nr:hypothetical protein [uncultured Methylibium sp.]
MRGRRWSLPAVLAFGAAAAGAAPALPPDELAAIHQAAGLQARDGGHYREGCATPLKPQAEVLDLDGDGRPEVLLYLAASRCFAQSLGGNVALFIKDAQGRWTERLGYVPGVEVIVQPTAHAGLLDLGVANPGGCMPIYRWDGTRYGYLSQKALQPGGCQFRE